MDKKDKEFLKRLRDIFRIESEEHIRAISAGLMDLEKHLGKEILPEVIETIFREAHSLKGAARSVDLRNVEAVCQPLEGAFSALKRQEIALSPAMCDLFHRTLNVIAELIASSDEEGKLTDRPNVRELMRQLTDVFQETASPDEPEGPEKVLETATRKNTPDTSSSREDQHNARMHDADRQITMETVRIPSQAGPASPPGRGNDSD
jgi:two-component system chemotaxis sensor kinase CheA